MNADECRQEAQYFIDLARQTTRLMDKAEMIFMAALWLNLADQQSKEPEEERC